MLPKPTARCILLWRTAFNQRRKVFVQCAFQRYFRKSDCRTFFMLPKSVKFCIFARESRELTPKISCAENETLSLNFGKHFHYDENPTRVRPNAAPRHNNASMTRDAATVEKNEAKRFRCCVSGKRSITPRCLWESLTTAELLTPSCSVFMRFWVFMAAEVNNALRFRDGELLFMGMCSALAVSGGNRFGASFGHFACAALFSFACHLFHLFSGILYITHINPRDYDTVLAQWDFFGSSAYTPRNGYINLLIPF